MRLLLALLLSGCATSDIREELVAHCIFGIRPVVSSDENSPYTIIVDGAIITIKCMEILE